VHIEGTFELDDLLLLAHRRSVPLLRPAPLLLRTQGLDQFLELLAWASALIETVEDASTLAYRLAARQTQSGIRYSEVIVNPTHWRGWRSRLGDLVGAFDEGFTQAEADGLCSCQMSISLLRDQTADEAIELVEWLTTDRPRRVVALSIDGNEERAGRSGPRFAEAFRRAGAAGLGRTVHAGESSGPDGVWDAIDLLGADRIDHGVRAIEDASLVNELARRQITLNICPDSNLRGGLYPSLAEHPIDRLRRAGVPVTLNTDDPGLKGLRLEQVYAAVGNAFGWTTDVYRSIARMSFDAAFIDSDRRSQYIEEIVP